MSTGTTFPIPHTHQFQRLFSNTKSDHRSFYYPIYFNPINFTKRQKRAKIITIFFSRNNLPISSCNEIIWQLFNTKITRISHYFFLQEINKAIHAVFGNFIKTYLPTLQIIWYDILPAFCFFTLSRGNFKMYFNFIKLKLHVLEYYFKKSWKVLSLTKFNPDKYFYWRFN